jgi:hypothetical protein
LLFGGDPNAVTASAGFQAIVFTGKPRWPQFIPERHPTVRKSKCLLLNCPACQRLTLGTYSDFQDSLVCRPGLEMPHQLGGYVTSVLGSGKIASLVAKRIKDAFEDGQIGRIDRLVAIMGGSVNRTKAHPAISLPSRHLKMLRQFDLSLLCLAFLGTQRLHGHC